VRPLDAVVPGGVAAFDRGANVEVIIVADQPDGHGLARRAIATERRDSYLFRSSDLVQLVMAPRSHGLVSSADGAAAYSASVT
jgi:hypothetical protein